MKMCIKCKTIALGESPTVCPNCNEPFLNYQTVKVDSKQSEL